MPHPLQQLGSLVIEYFRWSQLVPMITIWLFALLMVFMLFFVNHQDETLDDVGTVMTWVTELPVVGPAYLKWMEERVATDGTLHFGGDDFKVAATKAWVILSLVFMVIAWLANTLFGPFQPWKLKRKLSLAGVACVVLFIGFLGVYYLSLEMFNGSSAQWVLTFSGITMFVFLTSAWCLSIAHALGLLSRLVTDPRLGQGAPEDSQSIDDH
ncbi:MAG: hypothetical protein QNK19_05720 [Xanthomonadales bacterium]|nr:hypothetical protein [Xanthomonadales bacterium]